MSDPLSMPLLNVVAGPNGSGKTTLIHKFQSMDIELGTYINPDDIAANLSGLYEERVRKAQIIADQQRAECMFRKQSFTFETVMSHPSKIDVMRHAKEVGFFVQLFFIATNNPDINVARVKKRVSMGGHDVPEHLIRQRYERTLNLLPQAIEASHMAYLFDNSASFFKTTQDRQVLICTIESDKNKATLLKDGRPPDWIGTVLANKILRFQ
jgi:predicted ABC-type ATPase